MRYRHSHNWKELDNGYTSPNMDLPIENWIGPKLKSHLQHVHRRIIFSIESKNIQPTENRLTGVSQLKSSGLCRWLVSSYSKHGDVTGWVIITHCDKVQLVGSMHEFCSLLLFRDNLKQIETIDAQTSSKRPPGYVWSGLFLLQPWKHATAHILAKRFQTCFTLMAWLYSTARIIDVLSNESAEPPIGRQLQTHPGHMTFVFHVVATPTCSEAHHTHAPSLGQVAGWKGSLFLFLMLNWLFEERVLCLPGGSTDHSMPHLVQSLTFKLGQKACDCMWSVCSIIWVFHATKKPSLTRSLILTCLWGLLGVFSTRF